MDQHLMNVIQFLQPVNQGLRTVDRRSVLFRDLGKFVLGYKKGLLEENTPAHDHTRPHHYVHTHP